MAAWRVFRQRPPAGRLAVSADPASPGPAPSATPLAARHSPGSTGSTSRYLSKKRPSLAAWRPCQARREAALAFEPLRATPAAPAAPPAVGRPVPHGRRRAMPPCNTVRPSLEPTYLKAPLPRVTASSKGDRTPLYAGSAIPNKDRRDKARQRRATLDSTRRTTRKQVFSAAAQRSTPRWALAGPRLTRQPSALYNPRGDAALRGATQRHAQISSS